MAIRTQWTGANPRNKVVRSYTPASVGAKGHTGSVCLNQNGEVYVLWLVYVKNAYICWS